MRTVSFGEHKNLSNDTAGSVNPDISSSGKTLHTVWAEDTPGDNAIITRISNNSGQTFDNKVLIGNNDSLVSNPKIATSGDEVLIVSSTLDNSTNQDIHIKKSSNGGKSFEEGINLTQI